MKTAVLIIFFVTSLAMVPDCPASSQVFQTAHARFEIGSNGFLTSIVARGTGKEYCPAGHPSPLLSLHESSQPNDILVFPATVTFNDARREIQLHYPQGATAVVKAEARRNYLRFQLVSLEPRGTVDNIVWGPLATTLSGKIGDMIGVVRDADFAIGMFGLDDNTIAGPVVDGDCYGMGYYIHSPDPAKYPLPANLKEGQWLNIGGDGVNDVAFYSHPEEYYLQVFGTGARLEPAFGSSVAYHARDRRRSYVHTYSLLPGFKNSRPHTMVSDPIPGVDFIGSTVALYACPDDQALPVLETMFREEGLPFLTDADGKWIRNPAAIRPTLNWNGPVDKAIEYAKAMGFRDISRDTGEFYPSRDKKWVGTVPLANGKKLTYKEFGEMCHKEGLTHGGLHTLVLFLQNGCADVSPVPSEHLQTVCRTKLAGDVSPTDTEIVVNDPSFLAERGTWHGGDGSNFLRIGGEMLRYESLSESAPWTLRGVRRAQSGSKAAAHRAGEELVKLQQNCYHGFAPDMELMLDYADYYADLMARNAMDSIGFDGYESLTYQNHGYYAFKAFNRRLCEAYHKLTGRWPRITGSNVFAGCWEFMNQCNVGGGGNMFHPDSGQWAIEGKDIRNGFGNSYFPPTFGIQSWRKDIYDAETLMSMATAWDGTFALNVDAAAIEATPDKDAIFKAFNAWMEARGGQLFTKAQKEMMKDPAFKYHLERTGEGSFLLYKVVPFHEGFDSTPNPTDVTVANAGGEQPFQFMVQPDCDADGADITLPDGSVLRVDRKLERLQFIVCQGSYAYLAAPNKSKIADLTLEKPAHLPAGGGKISVKFRMADPRAKIRFGFWSWTLGQGEKVGKQLSANPSRPAVPSQFPAGSSASSPTSATQGAPVLETGAPVPVFAGKSRGYAVTAKGNFAAGSFAAEVTVTVRSGHGGNGCAFLGLGDGKPNPRAFDEPTAAPSLVFRLAPNDFVGGRVTAMVDGQEVDGAQLGDGTHRLRLIWDAGKKRALLQMHRNWKAGAVFEPTDSLLVPGVAAAFGEGTRLFVGGADGVAFADFSAKAATPENLAAFPLTDSFPKDPSVHTWLPVAGASAQAQGDAATDAFLKGIHASLRPVVCWYKGAELQASRPFSGGRLELPNSTWTSSVTVQAVEGEAGARDLALSVTLKEGGALSAGIAAAFDFAGWSTDRYVMVPASVYGANRNRVERRGYCNGFDKEDFYNRNLAQTTEEVPALAFEAGKPSKFEVSSCNAASPMLCLYDRQAGRGFIVLAEQAGRGTSGDFLRQADGEIMDNVFGVEENTDRSRATVVVGAPGVRSRRPRFIGLDESPDRGITFKAGDSVTLRLRLFIFDAKDMAAFLEKFMDVRKSLTGENQPRNLLPLSESLRQLTGRIDNRWYDDKSARFYRCENSTRLCLGWVGGLINTFPVLALGDEMHRERVFSTFDHVIPAAQGKSGFFYAAINPQQVPSGRDWFPNLPICLTRQEADVLFWTIKQFELLRTQGRAASIKPEWEASIKRLARAFVTTFDKYGQWGNYVNHETGEPAIYGSTSGALAIGGLALAADWFHDPAFMEAAKKAARHYYETDFIGKGLTYGACSDTMQNADSESAVALMTGLMTLYEKTGEKEWLDKSRAVSHLAASWVVSYDYQLPKSTGLGSRDTKLAGAVWASTQNKHGAPGFCTSSGDSFFKIYRATGETRYAGTMRDVIHAHAEALSAGGTLERLTYCDADSRGARPNGDTGWCTTDGALMDLEVPGIYLRTDLDRCFVFDSVKAQVLSRGPGGVKIEISNPTKYDARVAVFAENGEQAQAPLSCVAFLKWPKVEVKAGATQTVTVSPDGRVNEP